MPIYSVVMPGLAISQRLALTDCKQIITASHYTNCDARQVLYAAHWSDADNKQVVSAVYRGESDLLQIIFSIHQRNGDAAQVITSYHQLEGDMVQVISFTYQQDCDLEQIISAVYEAFPDILLRIMYSSIGAVRGLCHLITNEEISDKEVIDFIIKAQGRIDARLRQLYRIPLNGPVPEIINSIATDMAASFVLDKWYSDRRPDQTSLADVYMKRAEKDLETVIKENLLDGLPGIVKLEPPTPNARPAVASTTPGKSPLEDVLTKW